MTGDSKVKRLRKTELISKNILRKKKKRKGVQKKKLIDASYETNIKTIVEGHVSPENAYLHSASQ